MTALPVGLVQPDRRSCGAASMVAARMLLDASYAALVTSPAGRGFASETLAMHRRMASLAAPDGRMQVPWPRVIGIPPWAVAHQLSATGGPGLTPTAYSWRPVRLDPATTVHHIRTGLELGRPVALYVGDRWLPRHVVLAVNAMNAMNAMNAVDGSIDCYDPARGRVVSVVTSAFGAGRLPFGRWSRAWFVVFPTGSPSSRRTPA